MNVAGTIDQIRSSSYLSGHERGTDEGIREGRKQGYRQGTAAALGLLRERFGLDPHLVALVAMELELRQGSASTFLPEAAPGGASSIVAPPGLDTPAAAATVVGDPADAALSARTRGSFAPSTPGPAKLEAVGQAAEQAGPARLRLVKPAGRRGLLKRYLGEVDA